MTELEMTTECTKCHQQTRGKLHFDKVMKLVDSDGGLVFEDGWACHNCLGEPWSSADMVVNL